jgi:hypothetical protein
MRLFFHDFFIALVLTLLLGGAALWGGIWNGRLFEEPRKLEAKKSETLSAAELQGEIQNEPEERRAEQMAAKNGLTREHTIPRH